MSWDQIVDAVGWKFVVATLLYSMLGLTIREPKERREFYSFIGITLFVVLGFVLGGMRQGEWWFLIPLVIAWLISLAGRWYNPYRQPGWWQTPVAATIFTAGLVLCIPEDHGMIEGCIATLGLGVLIGLAVKAT